MKLNSHGIKPLVHPARSKFVCLTAALACCLAAFPVFAEGQTVVQLPPGVSSQTIQEALDSLPETGGEVRLSPGIIEVRQPIVLHCDGQELRGAGDSTILRLADGANCPVIIMGEPVNYPQNTVKHLRVSHLFIDGNRQHQQRELWCVEGEGSEIRNNGITVQSVSDSVVEHVTTARCRSGGLVTTRDVRRLTVSHLNSFDNQFDGLACYATEDCVFSDLDLHDNPGAGISLDLTFENNVIRNAVLTSNDLGIFMRESRHNEFQDITMRNCHNHGVFMAHSEESVANQWVPVPRTECTNNTFTRLMAIDCGGAAFRVNNATCTNNVIVCPVFQGNTRGGLSAPQPELVAVQ